MTLDHIIACPVNGTGCPQALIVFIFCVYPPGAGKADWGSTPRLHLERSDSLESPLRAEPRKWGERNVAAHWQGTSVIPNNWQVRSLF